MPTPSRRLRKAKHEKRGTKHEERRTTKELKKRIGRLLDADPPAVSPTIAAYIGTV